MKHRSLKDWAAIAEIIGTVAVVLSLLTVAYTIERNTTATSRQLVDELYNAHRDLQLLFLADADLAYMVRRGRDDLSSLTEKELIQYQSMVLIVLDVWEKGLVAEREGLIEADALTGWNTWYGDWVRRHLNRELWEEIKWNWNSPELRERVETVLAGK